MPISQLLDMERNSVSYLKFAFKLNFSSVFTLQVKALNSPLDLLAFNKFQSLLQLQVKMLSNSTTQVTKLETINTRRNIWILLLCKLYTQLPPTKWATVFTQKCHSSARIHLALYYVTNQKNSFILLYKMKVGSKGGLNFGSKYKKGNHELALNKREMSCVLRHCCTAFKVQDERASITLNSCAFLSRCDGVA